MSSRIKGQAITFNGQAAPIKNEADFKAVMSNEYGTYYVVFNSDVVIYKKSVTFCKEDAKRLFDKLMEEALNGYNASQTVAEKRKMADIILNMRVNQLRIH